MHTKFTFYDPFCHVMAINLCLYYTILIKNTIARIYNFRIEFEHGTTNSTTQTQNRELPHSQHPPVQKINRKYLNGHRQLRPTEPCRPRC